MVRKIFRGSQEGLEDGNPLGGEVWGEALKSLRLSVKTVVEMYTYYMYVIHYALY